MPSLRRPRITLFLGLFIFFLAHAVPYQHVRIPGLEDRTQYLGGNWLESWKVAADMITGTIPIADSFLYLLQFFLMAATVVLILVLPFLAAFLHRARPILWITRIILVVLVGFCIFTHIRIRIALHTAPFHGMEIDFLPGYWLYRASLVLYTLGLFFIPRPPSREVARS